MPRYTQPRRTWQYTNEFKVKAVELSHLNDVQVQDVAKTLDIHPFMLFRWRKEYREGKIVADKRTKLTGLGKEKQELDRLTKLEPENARLRRFQQAGENLRLRETPPTQYDRQWVADLTYIKVGATYQYLITIMDVFLRRILGWSLRKNRTVDDVLL